MTTIRWLGPGARWLLPAVGLVLASASCGMRPASNQPGSAAWSNRPHLRRCGSQPGMSCRAARPRMPAPPAGWCPGRGPVRWPPGRPRPPAPAPTATTPSGSQRAGMCWSPQRGRSSRTVLTSSSRSHHRRPSVPTSAAIAAFADTARPTPAPMVRPGSPRIHTHRPGQSRGQQPHRAHPEAGASPGTGGGCRLILSRAGPRRRASPSSASRSWSGSTWAGCTRWPATRSPTCRPGPRTSSHPSAVAVRVVRPGPLRRHDRRPEVAARRPSGWRRRRSGTASLLVWVKTTAAFPAASGCTAG